MQHHWPDADDDNDEYGDDHLTYEERLRVDSYKMLMPIIHLPYKPYQYQHRRLHDKLYCSYDNNNATAMSHSHQRQQGIVRRVSDDSVDVSGVASDMDDEESKAHTKEDEVSCKTHEQQSKQDSKEEDDKVLGCQMSQKTKAFDGGSNSR